MLLVCFTIVACNKDDDDCTALSEVIIGTWEAALLGTGSVEFKADKTLLDPNDLLFSGSSNGSQFSEKTWEVEGNSKLTLEAGDDTQFFSIDLNVSAFECDVISLEQLGVMIDLTRI